jgi:hypothetical protein
MSTLSGRGLRTVVAKTANYTVTANDCGTTFTNAAAAAEVVFALPAAAVGLWYKFKVKADFELRIDPNGTETIALPSTGVQQAAGAYLTANLGGEGCEIECVVAGAWEVNSYTGTWTAV